MMPASARRRSSLGTVFILALMSLCVGCGYTRVSGLITDSGGKPVSDAYVGLGWWKEGDSLFVSTHTDANGFYKLHQTEFCFIMCAGGEPPLLVEKQGFFPLTSWASWDHFTQKNITLTRLTEMTQRMYDDSQNRLSPRFNYALNNFAPHATPIPLRISILHDGFEPQDSDKVYMYDRRKHIGLSSSKPSEVTKEPAYQAGRRQEYGHFLLGYPVKKIFSFVFSFDGIVPAAIYFDRNGDGDLTNDALLSPTRDEQSNVIDFPDPTIPLATLFPNTTWSGDLRVYMYNLTPNLINFYMKTNLYGKIRVNQKELNAHLLDADMDGDFAHDAIAIDLNDDREIDLEKEIFTTKYPILIDGDYYKIDVKWEGDNL